MNREDLEIQIAKQLRDENGEEWDMLADSEKEKWVNVEIERYLENLEVRPEE